MEAPPPPVNPFPFAEDVPPVPRQDCGVERVVAFYRNLSRQAVPVLRFKHGAAIGYRRGDNTFILAFDQDSAPVASSAPVEWAESDLPFSAMDDQPVFLNAIRAVRREMQKTREQVSDLSLAAEDPSFPYLSDALPSLTVPVFPCAIPSPRTGEVNVLALAKEEERYVFLFDDTSRAEALRVLGRFASDPDLSFTWYDAAVLSQKIRNESQNVTQLDKLFPWAPPFLFQLLNLPPSSKKRGSCEEA